MTDPHVIPCVIQIPFIPLLKHAKNCSRIICKAAISRSTIFQDLSPLHQHENPFRPPPSPSPSRAFPDQGYIPGFEGEKEGVESVSKFRMWVTHKPEALVPWRHGRRACAHVVLATGTPGQLPFYLTSHRRSSCILELQCDY